MRAWEWLRQRNRPQRLADEHDAHLTRDEGRRTGALGRFLLDARHAVRSLVSRPLATIAAVLALAVGMAVPTALFMPLANLTAAVFPHATDPDALVTLWETPPNEPGRRMPASAATWEIWRSQSAALGQMSAAQPPLMLTLNWGELPEQVRVQPMEAGLLSFLGVAPAQGRAFVEGDRSPAAPAVALISDTFWQVRFGASDEALGSTLLVDGQPHTVVGIMPRSFWLTTTQTIDMWVPVRDDAPRDRPFVVFARLRRGDTPAALASRLTALAGQIAAANPGRDPGWGVRVAGVGPRSFMHDMLEQPGVLMLLAAITLALLVACANVAMVMVARGAARQKETAIRAALGASRWRLVRQFLLESTLVALAAAGLALLLAFALLQVFLSGSEELTVAGVPVGLDWRVVAAVLSLATAVGLCAGLAPALADSRVNLLAALKQTGFFGGAAGKQRVRRALIVIEVALTVMLLGSVTLLTRGIADVDSRPPGFDLRNLLIVRLDGVQHLAARASDRPDARATLERVRAVPGVLSAAAVIAALPGAGELQVVSVQGGPSPTRTSVREAVNHVSDGYFETLGIGVLQGIVFDEAPGWMDDVAVVSQAFARKHWPGRAALGQTLHIEGEAGPRQVVGVVADQLFEAGGRAATPIVFVPFTEDSRSAARPQLLTLLVRTTPDVRAAVNGIRRAVAESNPLQTVQVTPVRTILEIGFEERRLGVVLTSPLMGLALLLTVSGIYGLLAQSVAQRTHELAIRAALGAGARHLLRLVAGDGLLLTAVGAVIGAAGALGIDRVLSAFLYGVPGEEPLVLAGAGLLLMALTLAASWLPYRRAARLDIARTLRYE